MKTTPTSLAPAEAGSAVRHPPSARDAQGASDHETSRFIQAHGQPSQPYELTVRGMGLSYGSAAEPAATLSRLSAWPDADHQLVKAFAAEATARRLCSDKTLSHHVTGLNSLARWLAEPAQSQRFSGGLRALLQRVSQGRAEIIAAGAVLREFRHSGASADVKRRINYAFNALCKVTGAGAVVSESVFLDVSLEDAAVIRRFRRTALATPDNHPKTLANLSVTLKHLAKWLAPQGQLDLEGLQYCPDENRVSAVVQAFRHDPSVQGAAKSRTGAAVKALRAAAHGSVLLPRRPRRPSGFEGAADTEPAGLQDDDPLRED